MRSVLFGLLQAAGALAAIAGTYLLLGLPWTLVIAGTLTTGVLTAAEIMGARTAPPQAPARPRTVPDALPEPDVVTELPGAPRSRARKEA